MFQWFDNVENPSNVELKHSADHAYLTKDYARAIDLYSKALEVTTKKNMSSRRDILEGLARSNLKLENSEEAEKWAKALVSLPYNLFAA